MEPSSQAGQESIANIRDWHKVLAAAVKPRDAKHNDQNEECDGRISSERFHMEKVVAKWWASNDHGLLLSTSLGAKHKREMNTALSALQVLGQSGSPGLASI